MTTLVLVGAGHAHAQVLLEFGRQRPAGLTRLVLVSPHSLVPYSGMVPGWMAGHYRWEECCIDFARLCSKADAELISQEAVGIDAAADLLQLANGATLHYDWLSLNIGSTLQPPGHTDVLLPLRPLIELQPRWNSWLTKMRTKRSASVVMVGGGAAGVESMLATHHALTTQMPENRYEFTLVTHGNQLVPGLSHHAAHLLQHCLERQAIRIVTGFRAERCEKDTLQAADGRRLRADALLWATGAEPHTWTHATALEKDPCGFIRIDRYLRSSSHLNVFAAGDCAGWENPLPKAGVYAVRMGPLLAHNLRATIEGRALLCYLPQRRFLVLVGTGGTQAVASWGKFGWKGRWVWRWKEHIDRGFLAHYQV
ncbi:MAG: FAD-dependent oxidoreductase [Herbaspirillum sp.]